MNRRAVHFVGSFPADTTEGAMRAMLDAAGPRLRTLPTGETRRYEFYIRPIIENLVQQGVLEVDRPREWRSSRDRTRHRVPRGGRLVAEALDLGYRSEAEEALPIFRQLCPDHATSGTALQIGMPTDFTLAFIALGVTGVFRHRAAFAAATAREITRIRELAGDQVVIQLEATAELVLMASAQPLHRPVDTVLGLARGIAGIAAAAPAGTRFGVHLCLGSLHNKARATLRDTRPLVDLANAIVRHWPPDRPLEFLHAPLAAGDVPPPDRPEFYAPLRRLALGAQTAFYAGVVHETPTDEEQLHLLSLVEDALGRPVDGVASACGLGRRPRVVADALLTRAERTAAGGESGV
ncbi:hypothetical protein [Nocardia sp. NPDC024068]|uniref:hypothetical protein n=1 Tax=Nocardia sp. NPDC024068 TaxID=3157197 RepID=UPI003405415A